MKDWILSVLANKTQISVIMTILVIVICELFKCPIKLITKKISNSAIRKIVNGIILYPLIFGLSTVLVWLYCKYYLKNKVDLAFAKTVFTLAIASYSVVVEQIIKPLFNKVKKDTEDGEITVNEIKETVNIAKEKVGSAMSKAEKQHLQYFLSGESSQNDKNE